MDIATTVSHLLPALLLGMLLAAATVSDVLTHRIPNNVCLLLLVAGLACQYAVAGTAGVIAGIAGVATGLLLLLPFYAMGGMAAGDVKLLATAASFLGPVAAVFASLATLFIGALLAVGLVALKALQQARAQSEITGADRAASGSLRFPYALAITPGVFAGSLTGDSLIAGLFVPSALR
jgi:prepilin peptidase CpaA